MTEPKPTLRLKLPVRKDVLLSKLPPAVVVAMQKAQNKAKLKPKEEAKAKEQKQPVVKKIKEIKEVSKPKDKKMIPYEVYLKILKHLKKNYPDKFTRISVLPTGFSKVIVSEWSETTISKNEVKKFLLAYCRNEKYKELVVANNEKKPTLKTPPKNLALVTYKLYAEMLAYFQEKYPKCFTTPAMPLAIGIHKQMFEDEVELKVSRKQIRTFCAIYCAKPEYKESLKVGVPRLDLLGNTTSSVTEEELTPIKSMEKKSC